MENKIEVFIKKTNQDVNILKSRKDLLEAKLEDEYKKLSQIYDREAKLEEQLSNCNEQINSKVKKSKIIANSIFTALSATTVISIFAIIASTQNLFILPTILGALKVTAISAVASSGIIYGLNHINKLAKHKLKEKMITPVKEERQKIKNKLVKKINQREKTTNKFKSIQKDINIIDKEIYNREKVLESVGDFVSKGETCKDLGKATKDVVAELKSKKEGPTKVKKQTIYFAN